MDEKDLYKILVNYVGSPLYKKLNPKLRTLYSKHQYEAFEKLVKPYQQLAELNTKLGFNQHQTVYRGIIFRVKPYEPSWYHTSKDLDKYRKEFPYVKEFPEIQKGFTTEGSAFPINQLLATSTSRKIGESMAGFINPVNHMTKFLFTLPILKKNTNQVNIHKLYKYFNKKYSIDTLGLSKDVIDNFLIQVKAIDEILLVPDRTILYRIKEVRSVDNTFFISLSLDR